MDKILTEQCRILSKKVSDWARQNISTEYQHSSPYVYTRSAMEAGIITKEEHDMLREYHGNLWNYVGD